MAHHPKSKNEWAERHRKALTTRHPHEDVLNDREFALLLEACTALPDPRGFEARFVCLVGGRLGLRAGEIAHFQTSWIDWDRQLIRIPRHEPCGCGYCDAKRNKRQPTTNSLPYPMPSPRAGTRRLSPRPG